MKLSELNKTATLLIDDNIDFIEGIRAIRDCLDLIPIEEEDKDLFLLIDSETDDVPVGKTRSLWSKKALEEIDNKLEPYIVEMKQSVKDGCKKIIEIIGNLDS
jgi:hypothetical protein